MQLWKVLSFATFLFKLAFSQDALSAQTRAAALLPRPYDYLLLEHHLAAELHARYKRTVVPVYIGRLKSEGSCIHPASQPPQVSFCTANCQCVSAQRTCRAAISSATHPRCSLRITGQRPMMHSTGVCKRYWIVCRWVLRFARAPRCGPCCFRFALTSSSDSAPRHACWQPCALYIHGEVTSSMRSAAASVSSHVALAKGSFDWRSYLNKMSAPSSFFLFIIPSSSICADRLPLFSLQLISKYAGEMFTSCASSIMRPFAFMSRPISWILARVQGAFDALGVFWQSTHTRFIGPAFRGVRSYAVDPTLRFASHGLSFAASQLPASVRAVLPDVRRHLMRWPATWLLGLLALASPLLRYISAAVAKSLSSSMQE